MINIILVDDHHIVRQGIRTLLEIETDICVVEETDEQGELVHYLEKNPSVDIILMDINMPDTDGITLTQKIKKNYPEIHVIVLSMMDHEKYVSEAFEAGASAFLIKNISRDELLFAIRYVYKGQFYICSEIGLKLLKQSIKLSNRPLRAEAANLQINAREMEVLNLTADGYTNQEIADQLFTSKRTVEGYRQSLIEKTGVRNTAALIKFAFQHGLIK